MLNFLIGDIDIYDSIDGIVLNNKVSVNEVLNILQKIFFFDYYERDGKLYIVSKKTTSSLRIDEDELIELESSKLAEQINKLSAILLNTLS